MRRGQRDRRCRRCSASTTANSKSSRVRFTCVNVLSSKLDPRSCSSQSKQIQIDDLLHKLDEKDGEAERVRDEKDQEIAIMQEGMDTTIRQISELQNNQGETDEAVNAQIDTLVLDQEKKFNEM